MSDPVCRQKLSLESFALELVSRCGFFDGQLSVQNSVRCLYLCASVHINRHAHSTGRSNVRG